MTPRTYIALLRGINVSAKNMIKMKDLTAIFTALGCTSVVTYLQSGNVVFQCIEENEAVLEQTLEKAIRENLDLDVRVLIRTPDAMQHTVADNPLREETAVDPTRIYVTFLETEPTLTIVPPAGIADRFVVRGKTIYLHCPDNYGRTKLNNNFFERKLKCAATTRNWNTVTELVRLSSSEAQKNKV